MTYLVTFVVGAVCGMGGLVLAVHWSDNSCLFAAHRFSRWIPCVNQGGVWIHQRRQCGTCGLAQQRDL